MAKGKYKVAAAKNKLGGGTQGATPTGGIISGKKLGQKPPTGGIVSGKKIVGAAQPPNMIAQKGKGHPQK